MAPSRKTFMIGIGNEDAQNDFFMGGGESGIFRMIWLDAKAEQGKHTILLEIQQNIRDVRKSFN